MSKPAELNGLSGMVTLAGGPLGPYDIIGPIVAGGMGVVYRAYDLRLGRPVAIKMLPDRCASDRTLLRQFEREAKALSSINHPNIVTVYALGEQTEAHYIVMEFVEGWTLRKQIMAERMRLSAVLDVGTQVASALSAAHSAGVVHNDIKPENIMIRPDGLVKVLDFGLAKLTRPWPSSKSPGINTDVFNEDKLPVNTDVFNPETLEMDTDVFNEDTLQVNTDVFNPETLEVNTDVFHGDTLQVETDVFNEDTLETDEIPAPCADGYITATGAAGVHTRIMGTPSYMSPERLRGKDVDARTDIFSLGVTLYESIAGVAPFGGHTSSEIIYAILQKKPAPLRRYRKGVPREIEQIVARALRKDRDRRYQHVTELLSHLQDVQDGRKFETMLRRSAQPA